MYSLSMRVLLTEYALLFCICSTVSDAVLAAESLLCSCTAFEVHTSQGAFSHLERSILKCETVRASMSDVRNVWRHSDAMLSLSG